MYTDFQLSKFNNKKKPKFVICAHLLICTTYRSLKLCMCAPLELTLGIIPLIITLDAMCEASRHQTRPPLELTLGIIPLIITLGAHV